ncbi:MAG: TlpA family protein disulfide reductase [Odoribacter sp.]|nr:TlpA family protein disulfide reductase [Odoribacter sp.]
MRKAFVFYLLCLLSGSLFGENPSDTATVRTLNHYVFEDASGQKVSLGDLDSDYVFLELWSMSCRPCLLEMEFFKELPERYAGKPIRFVSICVENNVASWKRFLQQRRIGGIQWITPLLGAFQKENQFISVPRFVLVDREGRIVWNNAKRPSDPALKADLDKLLAK